MYFGTLKKGLPNNYLQVEMLRSLTGARRLARARATAALLARRTGTPCCQRGGVKQRRTTRPCPPQSGGARKAQRGNNRKGRFFEWVALCPTPALLLRKGAWQDAIRRVESGGISGASGGGRYSPPRPALHACMGKARKPLHCQRLQDAETQADREAH